MPETGALGVATSVLGRLPSRRQILGCAALAAPVALAWLVFNRPGGVAGPSQGRLLELAAWLLITAALLLARTERRRSIWVAATCAAAVMAAMRTLGAHFQPTDMRPFADFGPLAVVEFAANLATFTLVSVVVLRWLVGRPSLASPAATNSGARGQVGWRWPMVAVFALIQALCWTPYLLIFYPAIIVRDSWSSIIMGLGLDPMRNHHPVLFQLFIGWCMRIAAALGHPDPTHGALVYALIQATVMAVGLAICARWVGNRRGRIAGWVTLAFFALSPQVAMWSITMHKDSWFALWLTLLTLFLADTVRLGWASLSRLPRVLLWLGLLLALTFSRNNGPHIAAVLVLVVIVVAVHSRWRASTDRSAAPGWWRAPLAGVIALAITVGVQGPVYDHYRVIPGNYAESVGVPLQQIAWSTKYGHVTPEQAAAIAQLMPPDEMAAKYSPTIADTIKLDKNFNADWLNGHHSEFWALWLDLMPANAFGYTQAWFAMSGGYLDPGRQFTRFDAGTKNGSRMIEIHDRDLLAAALGRSPLAAPLAGMAQKISTWPGLNLVFAMPLVFWICALAAAASAIRGRLSGTLPYLPLVLCVGSLLVAAPVTDFRYVAAGHFALPIVAVCLWGGARARAAGD